MESVCEVPTTDSAPRGPVHAPADLHLPKVFGGVELGPWEDLSPTEAMLGDYVADPAVMLVYSRRGVIGYDEVAERVSAVTPRDPAGGLTGRRTMRTQTEHARRTRRPPHLEAVRLEQDQLGHRPIELPDIDGHLSYTVTASDITFRTDESPIEWRFSLTFPPAALSSGVVPDDVAQPLAWRIADPVKGVWFLPFDALVRRGAIDRWQDVRDELVSVVTPGALPLFISHRWLDTARPDPDGRQARLTAWQLVAAACEAVEVAAARGLHEPRRKWAPLGCRAGVGGSDLVESMIVALLRPTFDDALLRRAVSEARSVEELLGSSLVALADADTGLPRLRAVLDNRPVLAALTGRIHLWIDYCCLPQPPRIDDEELEFRAGLRLLNAVQLMGRTVILLDEVEEYTRRAWCLLEALTADRWSNGFDVLSSLAENTDPAGDPYDHLSRLLLDLPHVVWRALLDTEVLGTTAWRDALARLDLDVTDPDDLPYIYERLRAIPAPVRLHTMAGDLITGVVPLPELAPGIVAAPNDGSRPIDPLPTTPVGEAPWAHVPTLEGRGPVGATAPPRESAFVPLVRWSPAGRGRPEAHVAIIAACEGEAVLIADSLERSLGELEEFFGVDVTSRSWLADDVAPVGALVFAGLGREPIAAPNWILVTTSVRKEHCTVTSMLATTARRAGLALGWVLLDDGAVAVEDGFPAAQRDAGDVDSGLTIVALPPGGPARLGGVYRRDLAVFVSGADDG